ncbi:GL21816 [Drosophila persimilis]|uniref:GL21816 n=1 Tax=Drosophila persimilis TaxID=7234 RepID=B4GEH2_DROPE|nr:GL21816 [Drosophila persimilis]
MAGHSAEALTGEPRFSHSNTKTAPAQIAGRPPPVFAKFQPAAEWSGSGHNEANQRELETQSQSQSQTERQRQTQTTSLMEDGH